MRNAVSNGANRVVNVTGVAVLTVTAFVLAPVSAFGDSSSTDWALGLGGTYSWSGGNSSLVGTNIPTVDVLGLSTTLNNGASLAIVDGLLNFTSGAFTGTSSSWEWGPGSPGSLNITGCIAGVTASVCTGSNNVALVSDDFQSVQIVPVVGAIDAVFGNVTGKISASVAAYFGLPATAFSSGSFTTTIFTTGTPGRAFSGTNLLGALNAAPTVSAPERWGIGDTISSFVLALTACFAAVRLGLIRSHLFGAAAYTVSGKV